MILDVINDNFIGKIIINKIYTGNVFEDDNQIVVNNQILNFKAKDTGNLIPSRKGISLNKLGFEALIGIIKENEKDILKWLSSNEENLKSRRKPEFELKIEF